MNNIEEFYPLSPMQQGILFHTLYAPESGVYVEQLSFDIQGNLNVPLFQQAWQQLLERHPILRTSFIWEAIKEPVQVVHEKVKLPWQEQDLSELKLIEQQERINAYLIEEREQGFEISQAPLMRLKLLQLAENQYKFIWSHHHLLLDGWSSALLLQEVFKCYQILAQGKDVKLQKNRPYRDYIAWIQKQNLSKAETFWRQYLKGFTTVTSLGIDHNLSNQVNENKNYATQILRLSNTETAALQSLARQQQLTLNTIIQGAWTIILSRYSGENNIVFGGVVSGRPTTLAGVESMVGVFINTLPLRLNFNSQEFLIPWLKKLQIQQNEVRKYEHTPLIEIQKWSEISANQPLFETIFNFQNHSINSSIQKLTDNLKISNINSFIHPHYPLNVSVQVGTELSFEIFYDSHRFEDDKIARMLGHLKTLLLDMVANPQQRVGELTLLTTPERYQLLDGWNNTKVDYPLSCIHELFEAQVERTPLSVAVVFEEQQLTYCELNASSNQLAHHLRSLGVKPEVLVAICVERSLDMVIGLLAILKAGGAYVPLDPNYPQERLAYMLEDSQPGVLLTQQCLLESIPYHQAQVICVDSNWEQIASESTENPASNTTIDNLAYVIYTSGSTGKPKGAMNSHSGICNRLLWMQDTYQLTAADAVLQKTPFSFDVSVWEFFWTLITGARLVVAQPEGHRDPNYLVKLIRTQQITTLHFVPSMLQAFLEAEGLEKCQSLVRVIASGEALPAQLQQRFFNRLNAQLHNLYGPTEAAVDVTYWQCKKDNLSNKSIVPIGQPIANIQIYIVDKNLNPVPIGVTGEVYIGGVGVARGYLNRPDLSAEKFIPNPFSKEEATRLYKTGDLARYLPSGHIEYIGRIDNQVKVRGFRIELGEIEAVISQYPAVRETVVVVREDEVDSQRIVAYVVAQTEQTPAISELRNFLESKLPNYMVPAAFVILEALPLTPNGKVNRKSLPVPDVIRPELEETYIAPQTTVEKQLADIWAEVLGLEKIGIHDNFFELGGDSILSLQIISKASQAGLHLTPKQMFQYQTIAQLVTVVGTTEKIQAEQGVLTGTLDIIPIQQWFFEQQQPQAHHWNQAVFLENKQKIDPTVLEKVIESLLKHHDVLRSRFKQAESKTQALIASPDDTIPLTYLDFSVLPKDKQAAAIEAAANKLQASLNLSQGPLFRVAHFKLGDNQPSRLLWIVHHLAVDGVSWRVLIEDFQTAYQQISQGEAIKLPPKTTSYKQWSSRIQEYTQSSELLSELDFWLATQSKSISPIPRDFPDGNNLEETTSTVSVSLSVEETQSLLQEVPAAYRTQINDVLLTALTLTFNQRTGKNSLLIDLEGHGREEIFEDVDLSRTVGWFTSIFPVHLNLENANDLEEALKLIKEQLRAIPNRGIGYGLLRYLRQDKKIIEQFSSSKADVVFNYLGQLDQVLPESSLFGFAQESSGSTKSLQNKRTHLLEINCGIYQKNLEINWSYSNKLHRRTTIEELAQNFIETLQLLIAHCQSPDAGGFTPSDFVEFKQSQWNQADIDGIAAVVGSTKNRSIEDFYPLSPMQQGILFHTLADSKSGVYFMQSSWNLQGTLNVKAFRHAWQKVVERHSILRTCFVWEGLKEPAQIVHRQVNIPWQEYNWQHLSQEEQQHKLEVFLENDRSNVFELEQAPLMRLTLIQLSDTSYNFTWSHHHLLLDGWSVASVFKEVFACYKAFSNNLEISLEPIAQYRDYIVWLQQQNLYKAETFWRQTLKGYTTPTQLSVKKGKGATLLTQADDCNEGKLKLSLATTAALRSYAKQHQLTLNTILQGAWALILNWYSGQEDVVFGAVTSGRPPTLARAESMVGLFINTVPIRVQVSPEEFLLPWLHKIKDFLIEAGQYEYCPLVKIQRWSKIPKGSSMFESVVVFENYAVDPSVRHRDINLKIEDYCTFVKTSYPISLVVHPDEELLLKIICGDSARFDSNTITQMLRHLQTVIENMVVNRQQHLDELLEIVDGQADIHLKQLIEILNKSQKEQQILEKQEFQKARRQKLRKISRKPSTDIS